MHVFWRLGVLGKRRGGCRRRRSSPRSSSRCSPRRRRDDSNKRRASIRTRAGQRDHAVVRHRHERNSPHVGTATRGARLAPQALEELVRHVAEVSVDAVVRLVGQRIDGMGPCEARGYIRGRAGRIDPPHARQAVMRHPVADESWENAVAVRASDRVAPLVVRQLSIAASRAAEPRASPEQPAHDRKPVAKGSARGHQRISVAPDALASMNAQLAVQSARISKRSSARNSTTSSGCSAPPRIMTGQTVGPREPGARSAVARPRRMQTVVHSAGKVCEALRSDPSGAKAARPLAKLLEACRRRGQLDSSDLPANVILRSTEESCRM